jgi:hypothetical protein
MKALPLVENLTAQLLARPTAHLALQQSVAMMQESTPGAMSSRENFQISHLDRAALMRREHGMDPK